MAESASAFLQKFKSKEEATPAVNTSTMSATNFLTQFKPLGADASSRQEAGNTIDPVKAWDKYKYDIPELITTGIGAAKLSGVGTVPAALAQGGITAATDLGVQAYQKYKGEPQAPKSLGESALRAGGAFTRGALSVPFERFVLTPAFKKLGSWLSEPFSEAVTPEIRSGMEAAKRAGVEPSVSQVTESKPVQALERYAEYSWPFGAEITKRKQLAVKQLEDYAEKVSRNMGQDIPDEVRGEMWKGGTEAFEEQFKKAKDALYEPINKVLNDKPVQATNTIQAIKTVLSRKEGSSEGRALLQDWLERLTPKGNQAAGYVEQSFPTFSRLKAIRTEAGARGGKMDFGVTGMKAQIDSIYAAASQDMENLASQFGMKDALDAVNAQYSRGIKKLQDSLIKNIQKKAATAPESMHRLLVRRNSPTLVKTGREILGQEGFDQVRVQWFDDLVNQSKSIIEGQEVISPAKLANNLRKMGSTIPEMFADNPQLAKQIQDLSDVSKLMTRGSKVTQGSQTGYIVSTLKNIRGTLAASLIRTEGGKRFLTTGFPEFGQKFGAVAGKVGQVGAQYGAKKVQE